MRAAILKRLGIGLTAAAATVGLSGGGAVLAQDASVPNQTINTSLKQLNNSGASGTATVELLDNNQVKVKINVTGTSPGLPHAQHLHYASDKVNTCPTPEADKNNDGIIDTVEGQPSYGEIIVSLTTEGDTGKDSGLAVDRFPVADAQGNLNYERTFTLPEGVSREDVTESVIVHHGISKLFADKSKYDGDKKSPLKEDLPLEATVPAACGALMNLPVGGAGAGNGSTAGIENQAALLAGALSVTVGAALFGTRRFSGNRQ